MRKLSMTPAAVRSRKYRAEMTEARARNKAYRTRGKKPAAPSLGSRKGWHDPREVARKGATPWNDKVGLVHAMKEIGPDNDDFSSWPPFTREDAKPFIDPDPGPRRDPSEVVNGMKAQRSAPKRLGIVEEPLYSVVSQDAAKFRECLSECAKIIADAIVQGAKIIAGKEDTPEIKYHETDQVWHPVGPGTPLGAWLETAEIISGSYGTITNGFNTCMCRVLSLGDDPEWVEKEGGRTTVTHATFAAPTHWRWPAK